MPLVRGHRSRHEAARAVGRGCRSHRCGASGCGVQPAVVLEATVAGLVSSHRHGAAARRGPGKRARDGRQGLSPCSRSPPPMGRLTLELAIAAAGEHAVIPTAAPEREDPQPTGHAGSAAGRALPPHGRACERRRPCVRAPEGCRTHPSFDFLEMIHDASISEGKKQDEDLPLPSP